MKKRNIFLGLLVLLVGVYYLFPSNNIDILEFNAVHRLPRIDPDYTGIVIPPNIAPLNFFVNETGKRYHVKIYSADGEKIKIFSDTPSIEIPLSPWKKMLSLNRGQEIHFEVYAEDPQGRWNRFDLITNQIAGEDIDGFLVYRLIKPLYMLWKNIGIYQRNLQNYDESPVLENKSFGGCINCHSFHNHKPDNMILHMRYTPSTSMLLVRGDEVVDIDTRTDFNHSPASYRSWHPNGKLLAFSVNKVKQFFHAVGDNREVIDLASDLILYQIDSNTVTTSPKISSLERMETYPEWSPDGQYLYFCSAPKLKTDISFEQEYKNIKYDLMRISYNPEKGTWGELESVLSARETGLSIAHPKISPDGNYLLFCMCEFGNFTIYRPETDLYLMDLKTGKYHQLDINSDQSDSYHSWSSNSRWIVFSSKRRDGLFARPYFSYVDENGKAYKPFLLPQKDPTFYNSFVKTYNVPELISEPIKVSARKLLEAAFNNRKKAKLDPEVEPRPKAKSSEPVWRPVVP